MYFLSKKSGETSYSQCCCTKKIQPFVVFTLIFIEIIETKQHIEQHVPVPEFVSQ